MADWTKEELEQAKRWLPSVRAVDLLEMAKARDEATDRLRKMVAACEAVVASSGEQTTMGCMDPGGPSDPNYHRVRVYQMSLLVTALREAKDG